MEEYCYWKNISVRHWLSMYLNDLSMNSHSVFLFTSVYFYSQVCISVRSVSQNLVNWELLCNLLCRRLPSLISANFEVCLCSERHWAVPWCHNTILLKCCNVTALFGFFFGDKHQHFVSLTLPIQNNEYCVCPFFRLFAIFCWNDLYPIQCSY